MDVDSLSDEIVDLKAQIEDLESRLRDAQEEMDELRTKVPDLVEDAYREGFNDVRPVETEEDSWMRSLSRRNLRSLF